MSSCNDDADCTIARTTAAAADRGDSGHFCRMEMSRATLRCTRQHLLREVSLRHRIFDVIFFFYPAMSTPLSSMKFHFLTILNMNVSDSTTGKGGGRLRFIFIFCISLVRPSLVRVPCSVPTPKVRRRRHLLLKRHSHYREGL